MNQSRENKASNTMTPITMTPFTMTPITKVSTTKASRTDAPARSTRAFRGMPLRCLTQVAGAVSLCLVAASLQVTSAHAQTVSNYSPIVSSSNYVSSSSPLPNGGRIQTTYYPPQGNVSVAAVPDQAAPQTFAPQTEIRRIPTQSSYTAPAQSQTQVQSPTLGNVGNYYRPAPTTQYTVPTTQYTVPTTQYTVPTTQYTVPTTQYAVPTTQYQVPTSHATANRQVVRATTYQSPITQNQNPIPYYSNAPVNQSGAVPAASTQPTLLQNGVLAAQDPAQLNWQPVVGQTTIPANTYQPNVAYGACTPQVVGYPVQANSHYRPVSTYKPLVPLRSLPGTAYLGQGLLGQPKAYVQGEGVRNFFRYILP